MKLINDNTVKDIINECDNIENLTKKSLKVGN